MRWKKYKYLYRVFEVNELGQVRNESGAILNGSMHSLGFKVLNLRIKQEHSTLNKGLLMHRIVAQTWIPNPLQKPYVIHENGNLVDNKVSNLRWATQTEKISHQRDIGRLGNLKLTAIEVKKIKSLLEKGEQFVTDIAKQFNVSHTQIHRIKSNKNWKDAISNGL